MIVASCDTVQRWKRSEFCRPDPTGKNFQNKGGMGEVLKFVTLDGDLRKKKQKKFSFFAKMTQFEGLFSLSFDLKDLLWAARNVNKVSIKRTGGHKLNYRTFFLMILCERPNNKITIFGLLVTDYLQFAEQQT